MCFSGGTTTIAYDRLDRPVLTTDANGFKIFTRYDIISRPVVSGRYKGTASPGTSDPLYETPNTTAPHYYTSTAFPTDNNLDVYKVLYYDDYDLDNNGNLGSTETYEECRARGKELVEDGESMKIIMPKVKEAFGDEAELEYHVGCLKSEDV